MAANCGPESDVSLYSSAALCLKLATFACRTDARAISWPGFIGPPGWAAGIPTSPGNKGLNEVNRQPACASRPFLLKGAATPTSTERQSVGNTRPLQPQFREVETTHS